MTNYRESTTTRVATRRELQKALRKADLTREEELVLRLRYGIPEPLGARLDFHRGGSPEVVAKLALIEAEALARMRPQTADTEADEDLKSALVDRLRDL